MYFLLYYVVFAMKNNDLQLSIAKRPISCITLRYMINNLSDFTCARGAMYIDINIDIVHLLFLTFKWLRGAMDKASV